MNIQLIKLGTKNLPRRPCKRLRIGRARVAELVFEYFGYVIGTQMDRRQNNVSWLMIGKLNDEFAKDISDVESLADLKKAIRDDLKEQAARLSEERSKDELMKKIIQKTEYDIPEILINREIERILADVAYNYRIDLDKLREDEQKYKEYRENLRPRALESLKYELLLAEIAKTENISISEKEIDDEIKGFAKRQNKDFEELKKKMKENDTIGSLRYRLRIAKALNFVYDSAKLDQEKHLNFGTEREKA